MYGFNVGTLLILLLQTAPVFPGPPVNDIVAAVSKNVSDFDERVPDFICSEKINASRSEGGNVQERKTVESLFSESRKGGEQREITAIDGKPAKKNVKMPNLPTNWNGTFSGFLSATFSPNVHMERHFLNLPRSLTRLDLTADYGPVTIDGNQFWLPTFFRAEGTNPSQGKTRTFLYTAEFANCRKFASEIRLITQ